MKNIEISYVFEAENPSLEVLLEAQKNLIMLGSSGGLLRAEK